MKKASSCVFESHSLKQTHSGKARVICPGELLGIDGG